jgi:predicted TPR repeat methyltransferase
MTQAPYDAIADWYEREFLAAQASGDPIGIRQALVTLLGPGHGRCLELGCGTGARAADVRALGWTPVAGFPPCAPMPPGCRYATARWTR